MLTLNKTRIFAFLLLWSTSLVAGSIKIHNDSRYALTAIIRNSQSMEIDQVHLPVGAIVHWNDHGLKSNDQPQAPYYVELRCPCGETFGSFDLVPQAGRIKALSAAGTRSCPKKEDKTPPKAPPPKQPIPEQSEPKSDAIWGPP